jgi:GntR family transcriptional regulator
MSAIFDAYAQEDQASSGSFRSIKSRTPADQNDIHDNDEGPLTLWCTMCHIINMTPFDYKPQSGQSIFDAVVFAAKRAFISGDYLPGQEFPSVRALAADLKIHPNTAHKIVCEPPQARPGEKAQLLGHEVEALVVGARRVGLTQAELLDAIVERWNQIDIARGTQK